jgi:hypothetical protein
MPDVGSDYIQIVFKSVAADVFKMLANERKTLTHTRHIDLRGSCGETPVREGSDTED